MKKYLNNRFFTLYLSPFVLGLLTVFSFQPFNFTVINFFILPLLFYLVFYIKKKSKNIYRNKPFIKNLLIFGTTFGFAFFLSGTHWIVHSLTFDESFKIFIPFGLILIPLFLSLFFSITIVLIGPFLNLNFSSLLLFSGSLALADFLRSKILTGFPWNLWSYSFSWTLEILQILNKIGLFSFNLIIITIFLLPSVLFFNLGVLKKILTIFSIFLILFSFYIFGNHSINKNQNDIKLMKNKSYIKVISPNFELKYGVQIVEIKKRFEKLVRYSQPEKNVKTLFIWPEGVFSGYDFNQLGFLKQKFLKNFDENHLILFGINRYDEKLDGFYNSLVIVDNKMEIIAEYKKQKLVPFGEFLPFEKALNFIGFKKITEGRGSFLSGKKQNNIKIGNLNILPLVCYEIIFTKFVQKSDPNTNLIINISEDGWFGNSIGPQQHFAKGIFRAIEQNTYLIRSANKGISAVINNKGQILKKLDSNEIGNIKLDVPLIKNNDKIRNDLIFFILLITYILFFKFDKKNNEKK